MSGPPTVSAAQLAEVALTRREYDLAASRLGRLPSDVELGIIGALWSEHCGYKTSKPLLSRLPVTGPRVLQGPGENAGAVDIGGGLACVFKIESHNHPSAIEPYQGAATGVGGILRDVFTMGARPVALLDSLRFGPFEEPAQRRLLDGVVAGIGGYGNCIGVPTVGGEVYFDESYRFNCLVNAMCVGIIERERLTHATAAGPGNVVLLVGADTGRDGIHGATFASVELNESSAERRPAVQVGNPFLEKCLMEVCVALAGDPRIVAMQDLGAAGLTSATAELAHRGGCGIAIDIAHVSRRETGMTPYEVMLSEFQERMLLVRRPEDVASVQAEFDRWDLQSDGIGTITDSGRFVVSDGRSVVCDLPLAMLIDEVPLRHPAQRRPAGLDRALAADPLGMAPLVARGDAPPPARQSQHRQPPPHLPPLRPPGRRRHRDHPRRRCGASPGSRYDGGDRPLHRRQRPVRGARPRRGAAIAVCEAARNVVAVGAAPIALTNCLNFGNPEKPEVFWQLSEAIEGMREACLALGIPVVSGNVSLYNDTAGVGIAPTTVIGMVGHLEDLERRCAAGFAGDGDEVLLVGPVGMDLGGSEYQRLAHGVNAGPRPTLDLDLEARVQAVVLEAIGAGWLHSCHDLSEGGLAVALAESCILGGRGVHVTAPFFALGSPIVQTGLLFGESQSRFLVSAAAADVAALRAAAARHEVEVRELGVTGGSRVVVDGVLGLDLAGLEAAYAGALLAP